jgi:Mn2+/Fe2+ NRAMP family transporter
MEGCPIYSTIDGTNNIFLLAANVGAVKMPFTLFFQAPATGQKLCEEELQSIETRSTLK